jgi:Spy/CpxP family protein refolding chaperone
LKTAILASAAVLLPLAFQAAADDIKPFDAKLGLWETTSTTEISGMPAMPQIPEEQLAKMPPEQRAKIEAMIKGRGMGGPRTTTSKSCVTRESLEKAMAFGQNEESCTRKVITSTSSKQEIHIECTRGKNTMTGDLNIERLDGEHAKGSMVMKSAGAERPIDMKMSFTSKWLSADCGDVKPVVPK